MSGHDADLDFPACCAYCPHRRRFTAACTHDRRQSLLHELATGRPCPVYSREKTAAMRRLAGSE